MRDGQGRLIDYLRVSLTDRCNNRCIYCMPEDGISMMPYDKVLTYEEILRICRVSAQLGLRKIKLTGGEPLVRGDVPYLVEELKKIPGIEKVTLTTNGVLLKRQLKDLVHAGLDGINVSLDTLNQAEYLRITRRNDLEEVLAGINEASRYKGIPLKINCVPITSKESDLVALAKLAKEKEIHVRFIEVMPIGYGKKLPFCSEEKVKTLLEEACGQMQPYEHSLGEGPCRYYELPGFKGKIGFISAISHKFCKSCNRVRLTAEGHLKACLQYDTGGDLKLLMRAGCTDDELKERIRETILAKPVSHHFHEEKIGKEEHRGMSQIGG